ncbi:MAG: DNA primase catalytic subunit PriS [Thermoplasmata archaeon]
MEAEEERAKATLRYLKAKFGQYYKSHPLRLPPRFGRREFGFIFFDGGFVQRHLGFASEADLYSFVLSRLPAHLYHSAAYYESPGAPTMAEKGWMGADLIFDLDADHIPGWKEMGYKGMLEAVKEQVIRLIDEYLVGDLGFRERDMTIAFSGARGYHIHIRNPKVLTLESHERREIVDYITGTDLDLEQIARSEPFEVRSYKERTRTLKRLRIPTPSEPGWRGRAARGIIGWLDQVSRLPEEDALREIRRLEGVGKVKAQRIYDTMFKRLGRTQALDRVRGGVLDLFPKSGGLSLAAQGADLMKGATDEPVTSDIKRLIRLIGSLHGKTGFMVVSLTRDGLEDFDPLLEAIPDHYSHEKIRLHLPKGIKTDMMGETFNLKPGQNSVPEYLAIFMMCRGMATLASGTPYEGTLEPESGP